MAGLSAKLRDTIATTTDDSISVQEQLRTALQSNAVKIMDLFAEWDEDGDHKVSKQEFRKAVAELGFKHSRPHIDAVFEAFDEDASGFIEFAELHRGLQTKGKKKGKAGGGAASAKPGSPTGGGGTPGLGGAPTEEAAAGTAAAPAAARTRSRHPSVDTISPEQLLQQKLAQALSLNATRVIDLFREWDDNGDGVVSQKEFTRALPLLGLTVDGKAADTLFRSFDRDNTGEITLKELQHALRAGKGASIGESNQAGAAGAIETTTGVRLRKHVKRDGPKVDSALARIFGETEPDEGGSDSDEEENERGFEGGKVVVRLRDALAKLGTRVIDLFKQWDADSDGVVSRDEFHKAMPLLGLRATYSEIDKLFNLFDPDRSGTIDYRELNAQLRKHNESAAAPTERVFFRAKNTVGPRVFASVPPDAATHVVIKAEIDKEVASSPWLNKLGDDASSKDAIAAVRGMLCENAARVIDLFRQWDRDGSGAVSKGEFRNAIKFLGLKCSPAEVDGLFEEMDTDSSGELSLREINRDLRRGAAGDVKMVMPSTNAAGAVAVVTAAKNDSGLRKEKGGGGKTKIDLSEAAIVVEKQEAAKQARKAQTNTAAAKARARAEGA